VPGDKADLLFHGYFDWLVEQRPSVATLIYTAKTALHNAGYELDLLRNLDKGDASQMGIGLGIQQMIRQGLKSIEWKESQKALLIAVSNNSRPNSSNSTMSEENAQIDPFKNLQNPPSDI